MNQAGAQEVEWVKALYPDGREWKACLNGRVLARISQAGLPGMDQRFYYWWVYLGAVAAGGEANTEQEAKRSVQRALNEAVAYLTGEGN